MYVPQIDEVKDWTEIAAFIRDNGFGLLITITEALPIATHIPILLEKNERPQNSRLIGHIAKVNQQHHTFTNDQTALAIFTAPHAYISSSWYHTDKVPTWNYMAVHVYGKISLLSESELEESLRLLMKKYEAGEKHSLNFDDIDQQKAKANMKAIVGFSLDIEKVEARFKLSQNKDDIDYDQIINHLQQRDDEGSHFIAEEMCRRKKNS